MIFLSKLKIAFFKNGVCHGVAFKDIYKGMYYPAVSVYKNASVWYLFFLEKLLQNFNINILRLS